MASSVLGEVGRSLQEAAGRRHNPVPTTDYWRGAGVDSPFEWFLFVPEFVATLVQLDGVP